MKGGRRFPVESRIRRNGKAAALQESFGVKTGREMVKKKEKRVLKPSSGHAFQAEERVRQYRAQEGRGARAQGM